MAILMKPIFILVALLCLSTAHAAVDLNADGFSDIWRLKFPGPPLDPGADQDGDGQSNAAEEVIGTDPYRSNDVIRVTSVNRVGQEIQLRWPSIPGKRYLVECSNTLGAAAWTAVGESLLGTGSEITTTHGNPTSGCFYRVRIFDVDTDSDGISDWEELQVGYDPDENHVHSCGCGSTCTCGPGCTCGGDDLARLTHALESPSVVTIEAGDADATEPLGSETADTATLKIRRTGGIASLMVRVSKSGATTPSDHETLPDSVFLPLAASEAAVTVTPLADSVIESNEAVILTVATDAAYSVGAATAAAVVIHDRIQANGSGLLGQYWKHPNTTSNAPYFTGTSTISRIEPTVNFNNTVAAWPGTPITTGTGTAGVSNYFSSRWSGEILPEFSQYYTIFANTNDAGRLWLNGNLLINKWPPATVASSEQSVVVFLEAGKRHPIVLEHYNNTGGHVAVLSWQSSSQVKQVIPQNRLFPTTPPQILGPYEAWAFVGAPAFNYPIIASGSPTSYSAAPLPSGFSINTNTGVITGNPTVPGAFDIALTASNAYGSGSAILRLNVLNVGSGITRELWTGVAGSSISSIPVSTPPTSTSTLSSLSAPVDSGDDYGARIRGFITAPATGDYRFFLRADEAAEFWLSNDDEPVNAWKRAELTSPASGTDWSTSAKSPLLRLEAGKRYYLEILHKESTGGDHLAIGWSKPGESDSVPSEIVPGHVLTRFEDVSLGASPDGTLYFAQLVPQSGAITNGYGTCTIRLSPDRTTAWVTPTFANLGSAFTGMHVHDTRLPSTSNIVFDPDDVGVEKLPDGSIVWPIVGVGGLSAAEVADGIGQTAYFNIHTAVYPSGEIKGTFRALDGSSTFTPPPSPPSWTGESAAAIGDANAASRFLQQATFGASPADISALQASSSYESWIENEFSKPITYHLPYVEKFRNVSSPNNSTYPGTLSFNSWWKNSVEANDQLRQRIAFAINEIMVVSENGPLDDRANALSGFYDTLLNHAFGNARDLLENVTLHPAMGRYLDMLRNDKPNLSSGLIPNENYAREILQLFSLGLNRMHPDGSLILNSKVLPIPVYDQDAIVGFAHGFTGWDYHYTGAYRTSFGASTQWTEPMRVVPSRHYIGKKRILNNVVLPGISTLGGAPIDPYATHSSTQIIDPAYQALGDQELDAIHDQIFQHPNFGPFFCRQLIQRLVTSTPSRGYIYRVVSRFNNNGAGIRGDMKALIKAILLDYEARSAVASQAPGFGKQREPVTRVTQLVRAFRPANNFSGSSNQVGGLITVDTSPTPHRLSTNQKVLLGFTSTGIPSTDADYSVLSVSGSTFTVRARDIHASTWMQTDTVLTITTPSNHGFLAGQAVLLRFNTGSGPGNGIYTVIPATEANKFTVTAPASTGSGTCDVGFIRGIYSQRTTGGVATLTVTCNTVQGLSVGGKLVLSFIPVTGQTTIPASGSYTITSVSGTDSRQYIVTPDVGTLPVTASTLSGNFHGTSPTMIMDRAGTAVSGYSDWNVGDTDTDLGQTPLRSPTVFNYFLPDYQHAGLLASSGLITPEFQLSSETNVVRQSNFLFGGIYSSSSSVTSGAYTNGFSSFKSGGHDMMMDLSPWMGPRTSGTDYWTNTANLRNLIREFSKLLMAGRMSTALENEIYNFVSLTTNITYGSTPTETERRNRVRAIVYFISISPENAIQR
jgi:hypothetical protein